LIALDQNVVAVCDKGVVKEYCTTIGCNLGTVRSEVRWDLIVAELVKYPRLLWKLEFYFRVRRGCPLDPVLGHIYRDGTCKNAV